MANVYCENNVSFSVNEEEKDILQKSHDILKNLKHDWFIRDNDAWDNEDYWNLENAVEMMERLFDCKKK